MTREITERFEMLRERVQTAYGTLGGSSGRPYLYFIYPPSDELLVRRLLDERFSIVPGLHPLRIDLLPITLGALRDQEERRQALLTDATTADSAGGAIARMWTRMLHKELTRSVAEFDGNMRPLVLLEGLAALHPLTNPTALMEALAESNLDQPATGLPVPIALFVPGVRPPQTSRLYQFLGLPSRQFSFYRGEEI